MAAVGSFSSSLKMLFAGLCLLFSTVAHLSFHVSGSGARGFSMELIHRDSPKSPLYHPASTPFSRLHAFLDRSSSRANYLRSSNSHNSNSYKLDGISSSVTNDNWEFHVLAKVGSQKKTVILKIDLVAIFNSVLCYPCKNIDEHVIFNPGKSESYLKVLCSDHRCSLVRYKPCVDDGSMCKYSFHNAKNDSIYEGNLFTDKVALYEGNKIVSYEHMTFGCTHTVKGEYFYKKNIGVMSLSKSPISFAMELGNRFYRNWFSICLSTKENSGQLNFGYKANISGDWAAPTPLVNGIDRYGYTLHVLSITVAGAEDQPNIMTPPLHDDNIVIFGSNIMLDTSTPFTFIDHAAMLDLSKKVIDHTPYRPKLRYQSMREMINNMFDLCFDISHANHSNLQFPKITFHFARGARLVLIKKNAFLKVDNTTACLSILSNTHIGRTSILGTHAQMGHHILFDLEKREATFRRENTCQLIVS